jgi:nucleoside-diphosphate-sugar epimerase
MFTILGGGGFIGRHLVATLRAQGEEVWVPPRHAPDLFERPLGDVVHAAGVAAAREVRSRPFATVEAHVCLLRRVLEEADFRSLLYLSSTRVYGHGTSVPAVESQTLSVDPASSNQLYPLSKLMGEALCHAAHRDGVRVVRLSNVYGSDDESERFVPTVLRSALREGRVVLRTALDSAKDYISVEDVVRLLPEVARRGKARIYNIATGYNVSHRELLAAIAAAVPLSVEVEPGAPTLVVPPISIGRAQEELGFMPRRRLLDDVPELVARLADRIADG